MVHLQADRTHTWYILDPLTSSLTAFDRDNQPLLERRLRSRGMPPTPSWVSVYDSRWPDREVVRIDLARMEARVPSVEEGGEPEVFRVRRVRMDGVEEELPARTRRTWRSVEGAVMEAARWRFRSANPHAPETAEESEVAAGADDDDAVLDALLERVRIRREEMRSRAARVPVAHERSEDAEEQGGDTPTSELSRVLFLGRSVGSRGGGRATMITGMRDSFRLQEVDDGNGETTAEGEEQEKDEEEGEVQRG